MFTPRDRKWLADRHLDYGVGDGPIVHAEGHVQLTAEAIEQALQSTVVIDGDLTVDGRLAVQDDQALVVSGRVRCESFWIGEGKLCAGELSVAQFATFACWGDDMCYFEVDDMTTPVLCSPTSGLPGTLGNLDCQYVLETTRGIAEESKLLSWILDDSFDAVYAALKGGEVIDDAWCSTHANLVKDAQRRGHLEASQPPSEISARVRHLLDAIKDGATAEEADFQGRSAIRIVYPDGSTQLSILSDDELATFRDNRPRV